MGALRFDGRVALVTGGGGSIGRAHAMLLASRGAKVVVNDLNTSVAGEAGQPGTNPADQVVQELRALGAEAVVNHDSVADGQGAASMVQAAMDHFGRIDIIVNNAGIAVCNYAHEEPGPLYERNMSILLEGPMRVVRAGLAPYAGTEVRPHPQHQFGVDLRVQPARRQLVGLVRAGQVRDRGLHPPARRVRRVAGHQGQRDPAAGYSRMNWDLLKGTPEGEFLEKHATAASVAAAAGYLLHEECPVSGASFSVSGGRIARVLYAEPLGYHKNGLTPEDVRDHWAQAMGRVDGDYRLNDFYEIPNLVQESMLMLKAGVGSS